MIARAFSFDYDLTMQPAERDEVCAWLRANGVDPGSVPVTAVVQVDAATVTIRG